MRIPIISIACKQVHPLLPFHVGGGAHLGRDHLDRWYCPKDKVLFVVGATGTGKSRLAIDLATKLRAEIINSDKMQLYKGLDIATNKVTEEECRGVPHHLLGVVPDPDASFSASEFARHATNSIESILSREHLPIVAGGSNSYIEALVDGPGSQFSLRYECCFLWVHVEPSVLRTFVSDRVDRMVAAGLVEEVTRLFNPEADYSRGIRRAIGVPELDEFIRAKRRGERDTSRLLREAVEHIKENTCRLAARQFQKIERLHKKWGRKGNFLILDATESFSVRRLSEEAAEDIWESLVAGPAMNVIDEFLYGEGLASVNVPPQVPAAAVERVTGRANGIEYSNLYRTGPKRVPQNLLHH